MYKATQMKSFDLVISLLLLILSFPVIIIFMLIILITTRQTPIIIQERKTSLSAKKIRIYKLRTIKITDSLQESCNNPNAIMFRQDLKKYVSPFCTWLRKSGLDELVQLINVLKGEMSLVGPRPLTITDLQIMKKFEPEIHRRREKIKSQSGITGYWQIFGDRNKGLQNLILLDEYYEMNKSFVLDLKLLFNTIVLVMTAKHSDSIVDSQRDSRNEAREKVVKLEEIRNAN
jgi:lipopolysaccharide/colanic/teichoic acid biosynthesis glycosyltransferase